MANLLQRLVHHCPVCERGYEIEIPLAVRALPFQFVCPGCDRKYEVRLAFLRVVKQPSAAGAE